MNVKPHESIGTRGSPAFFTVIVPMYNMEQYIEESLRSVLDQPFHSVELIVVDDGSVDGSVENCLNLMRLGYEYILLGQRQGGPMLPAIWDLIMLQAGTCCSWTEMIALEPQRFNSCTMK